MQYPQPVVGSTTTRLPDTIAIDGPVGSGKSTIGLLLAKLLGYTFFDTGVMYRAVTWAALNRKVDISNEQAMVDLVRSLDIQVSPPTEDEAHPYRVCIDGVDITHWIRSREVEQAVSPVAALPGVRAELVKAQRRIGRQGQIVMAGRDIGTVVMPDADLKIFLDASEEERAHRRHRENLEKGQLSNYEEVLVAVKRRDQIDSHRAASPLRPAEDAHIVHTDGLEIEQSFERIKRLVDGWRPTQKDRR